MNARIQISSLSARESVVSPWGFEIECQYDYEPEEPAIWSPIDRAHPGSPANAALISAKVGGVEITEMLDLCQRERIEEAILEQLES